MARQLVERPGAAVMVVKKQGSYLEEDRGSGGIRSELGLVGGQLRYKFTPIHSYTGIKRLT